MTNETPAPKASKTTKSKIAAGAAIALPLMVAGLLIDDGLKKLKARKSASEETVTEK